MAFAIRSRVPRLRRTIPFALVIAVGIGVAMVVLIPPRGEIKDPQYYAHGPDIPRALEAVEAARRTSGVLDQELDAQLVGLANLVIDPGRRQSLARRPVITVASDLHNNPFGLDVLERTADGRPGVLRRRPDRPRFRARDAAGAPGRAQREAVRVRVRQPRQRLPLPRAGAARARSCSRATAGSTPDGTFGPVIYRYNDLRIAGYDDPFERQSSESFRDRYDATPDAAQPGLFWDWLQPLLGKVDIVMVHEPALIQTALDALEANPPARPLVFLVGHTHKADLYHPAGRDA